MSRLRAGVALAALALLAFTPGCGAEAPQDQAAKPLPPGNLLPEDVETMVFGSPSTCREDADCASGLCRYSACGGLVSTDARWLQERVGDVLVAHLEGQPELRARVIWHLSRVLRRPRLELALRARCVIGLELLGAFEALEGALDDLPEPIAEAAAVALTRMGRATGLAHTEALTEHDSIPIAVEALRALGASGRAEALPTLLAHLNPSLEGALQRAALDGLAALGDPRALRPLVAYLADVPDYLLLRAVKTTRSLAGVQISEDLDAWRRWVAANPPPDPPPYARREYRSDEDIGLPTP